MTTRSPREQRMAAAIEGVDNALPGESLKETPEEQAARFNRNWMEIKKARIYALKQRNTKGVGILDKELEAGRGIDFPADADFEDADLGSPAEDDSDLGVESAAPVAAPRASQADVRKAEPPMSLIEQEAAERGWENARREYIKKHGVLTKGKTQSQAISEATGRRDPAETRGAAEAQHAIDTGELIYGDSAFYNIAKPAAAIAGFAAQGPAGAVGAEMLVRATALGYNLNAALDKGMDPEQAGEIFVSELAKGVGIDAVFNFGMPILGNVIAKIPGIKRIAKHIQAAIDKRLGVTPKPPLHETRIEQRAAEAAAVNPKRGEAVKELSKRVEQDFIPTPGQATGKAGITERVVTKSFPKQFEEQEAALRAGAEKMRQELVSPNSQAAPKQLGEQIVRLVDETVAATKRRLRPVFQEADNLKIIADVNGIGNIARAALDKNKMALGRGKLTEAEVKHLEQIVKDADFQPWKGAEEVLDFISTEKSILRKLNPDGKPTPYFSTIVRDMTKAADAAYEESARRWGQHAIVPKLRAAREDYRAMMETAYDGAIKQALRKGDHAPEDIGRYLWQDGKVTRVEELDELLKLAQKEGVASAAALGRVRRNVTRGFMQQAVKDVESAANWSKSLADPQRRATWEVLTRGSEGAALKNGMDVLEQAAQIALMRDTSKQSPFLGIGLSRAAGGGLGISWVTGAFNPYLVGAGLSIAGTMRLMATAYTRGDKGTINLLAKVLRANSAATGASAKALQAMLPQLSEAAKKYDVTDLFLKEEAEEQLGEQSETK